MDGAGAPRLTPWVGRLMVVNAVVFLLLNTVFTAPRFTTALAFDPARFLSQPWTPLTYLFVHDGLLHLAVITLMLFAFGPSVERRIGGRSFLAFYLYCGAGAALFGLGLSSLVRIDPIVGGSGALFGVMAAVVLAWPEPDRAAIPVVMPVTVRSLFAALVAADVLAGIATTTLGVPSGIAHFAHVGGAAAGYIFIRIQMLTTRRIPPRPTPVARRPVVTPMRMHEAAREGRAPAGPDIAPAAPEFSPEEVDRVLDKIGRFGISSLTSQERRFLSEASERKRKELP